MFSPPFPLVQNDNWLDSNPDLTIRSHVLYHFGTIKKILTARLSFLCHFSWCWAVMSWIQTLDLTISSCVLCCCATLKLFLQETFFSTIFTCCRESSGWIQTLYLTIRSRVLYHCAVINIFFHIKCFHHHFPLVPNDNCWIQTLILQSKVMCFTTLVQ